MKLRNKKTEEIGELMPYVIDEKIAVWIENKSCPEYRYDSLAELNEEWEDYEEPKEYWYIDWDGEVCYSNINVGIEEMKEIGNYFETKEEAEKAVDKLKAWKRLKDKGFRFDGYNVDFEGFWVIYPNDTEGTWCLADDKDALDLLFGGEE